MKNTDKKPHEMEPREYFRVLNSLEEESKVSKITKSDNWGGIYLDSLSELETALRFYDNGLSEGRECKERQAKEILRTGGLLGAGLASMAYDSIRKEQGDFVKVIMKDVRAHLKDSWSYNRTFEYGFGGGTNFDKTYINIGSMGKTFEKRKGYLFEIGPSESDDSVQAKIAKYMKKPRALESADINIVMTPVQKWFFNANFKKILGPFLMGREIETLFRGIVKYNFFPMDRRIVITPSDARDPDLELQVDLHCSRYLEVGKSDSNGPVSGIISRGFNLKGSLNQDYSRDPTYEERNEVPTNARPLIIDLKFNYPGIFGEVNNPLVETKYQRILQRCRNSVKQKIEGTLEEQ